MKLRDTLALLCIGSLSRFAGAQSAPPAINYQGRLTQSNGVVVPDGLTGMRVRIFATASGGTALWDSGDLSVATKSGTFSLLLGSGGMPAMSPAVFALGTVYIEVQPFGQGPLLPRQPIASVPWALYAQTVSSNSIDSTKLAQDDLSLGKISGNVINRSSQQRIGIGTGDPNSLLEIMGPSARLTINSPSLPGIDFRHSGSLRETITHNENLGSLDFNQTYASDGWSYRFLFMGAEKMRIMGSGNVGIGTSDPQARLDVNGIVQAADIFRVVGGSPKVDFKRDTAGFNIRMTNDEDQVLSLLTTTGQPDAYLKLGQIILKGSQPYMMFAGTAAAGPFLDVNPSHSSINVNQATLTCAHTPLSLVCAGDAQKPGGGSWSVQSDARLKKDIGCIPDP